MIEAKSSSRAVRTKACELAAQCLQGQCGVGTGVGRRLMSLAIFFENYISEGANQTQETMRLLSPRKVKKLRVISGAGL